MKKYILALIFLFSILGKAYSVPDNVMSIVPPAIDDTVIKASDENTRNNEISSKFNAHSHTDISQTANTLNIGDAIAGNKTITAYNADTDKPYIRYDDTNNRWVISQDGTNISSFVVTTGASVLHFILPQTPVQGDILYSDGSNWQKLSAGTSGQALTTSGASANPVWMGMTTQGDIEYRDANGRARLAASTSGLALFTQGTGANPYWGTTATGDMRYADTRSAIKTFTRDISVTGTQEITGLSSTPKLVIIQGGVDNVNAGSFGADDGTIHFVTLLTYAGTANRFQTTNQGSIYIEIDGSNYALANITATDSSSFTLTWTKGGSPTGTVQMMAMVFY